MHILSFATPLLVTFSTIVTGHALPDKASKYQWSVTDFSFGSSPGGSSAQGNVSAPAKGKIPAFEVECFATGFDTTYQPCTGGDSETDVAFYWQFKGSNSNDIILHYRYKAPGQTFVARKTIKEPGYKETVKFKLTPKKK